MPVPFVAVPSPVWLKWIGIDNLLGERGKSALLKFAIINHFLKHMLITTISSWICWHFLDSEGRTPLHWAVDRGHFDAVETLICKNADVNAKVSNRLYLLASHICIPNLFCCQQCVSSFPFVSFCFHFDTLHLNCFCWSCD